MEQKSHGVLSKLLVSKGQNALEEAPNQSAVEEGSDILNVLAVVSISAGALRKMTNRHSRTKSSCLPLIGNYKSDIYSSSRNVLRRIYLHCLSSCKAVTI